MCSESKKTARGLAVTLLLAAGCSDGGLRAPTGHGGGTAGSSGVGSAGGAGGGSGASTGGSGAVGAAGTGASGAPGTGLGGTASPGCLPPALTTVTLSLAANPIEWDQQTVATAAGFDQCGEAIATGPASYASSDPVIAAINPTTGGIFALSTGATTITATIEGKTAAQILTVFKAPIRINEIQSNSDAPGGWVELFNPTAAPVDMSGWVLAGEDLFQELEVSAGTTLAPGGFLIIDEASFPQGLGAAGVVHLFSGYGVQVDEYGWDATPATTYGRCPDGAGDFTTTTAPTKGAANACSPPAFTTIRLSLADDSIEQGQTTTATVTALDQFGAPIVAGPVTYGADAPYASVDSTGSILGVSPGTTQITATIDGRTVSQALTVFRSPIVINEVWPNGDAPGGWVELFNPTTANVDMSGWTVTGRDVTARFVLPAGTTIAPGGYVVVDESSLPLGLNASDRGHLIGRYGIQVDTRNWTVDPGGPRMAAAPMATVPSLLRPAPSKGAANDMPSAVTARPLRGQARARRSGPFPAPGRSRGHHCRLSPGPVPEASSVLSATTTSSGVVFSEGTMVS